MLSFLKTKPILNSLFLPQISSTVSGSKKYLAKFHIDIFLSLEAREGFAEERSFQDDQTIQTLMIQTSLFLERKDFIDIAVLSRYLLSFEPSATLPVPTIKPILQLAALELFSKH